MKKLYSTCAIPLLTLMLSPLAFADITGKYVCTGYDPFLKENYDTTLTINKTGDTYKIEWVEVNDSYSGIGVIENNVIASIFYNNGLPKRYGVMLYTPVGKDGLRGKWTHFFQELAGTEDCKRSRATGDEPSKTPNTPTDTGKKGPKRHHMSI